jgi:hypothetical protein
MWHFVERAQLAEYGLYDADAYIPGALNLLLLKLSYVARKVDVNREEQLLPET